MQLCTDGVKIPRWNLPVQAGACLVDAEEGGCDADFYNHWAIGFRFEGDACAARTLRAFTIGGPVLCDLAKLRNEVAAEVRQGGRPQVLVDPVRVRS